MGLFQAIETRLRQHQRLPELARRIAASNFDSVWNRVQVRIFSLPPAEARGYVRARARMVIEQAIADITAELGGPTRARLYALAMDSTVRHVTNHAHAAWTQEERRRAA